jgi:microcystin-dependent protein
MSEPFIAEIRIFAGTFAPRNWAFCNGQLLQISQNTALFSLVGTTYGGDGRTTFGLPNLQGRAAMHWGSGSGLTTRSIGASGGAETVTLTSAHLPAHSHALGVNQTSAANQDDPSSTAVPGTTVGANVYGGASNLVPMATDALGAAGGGQSHTNMQPFLVLNFIIAIAGTFPSRN